MKKLFLTSSFKDVESIFVNYEKNLEGKTVTFIPTASVVEKIVYYVAAGKKVFEKLGMIVDVLDVSVASEEEIKEKLIKNDFIYVSGGNTFYLLQELKRTKADKLIIEQVENGKLYIGESAGSVIVAPNIEYIKGMDSVKKAPNLENFEALNLVDFYPVPHCADFPFSKVAQKIISTYAQELNLLAINNKQAIIVEGDKSWIETTS